MSKILLAVSGGIDSMYMAMRRNELFPKGTQFALAHCNFSLRASESDGDEAFIRSWCESEALAVYIKRFDTRAYASANGISIEMAARDLRYEWFAQLLETQGFDAVAVAHNANDNAETLILNLLRGTGSKGLRGMSSHSNIIRPLLGISRAEIRAWMEAHNAKWREDSTNAENDCKRNIIRNSVFPLFEQINPSFVRTLNSDMERFAQVDDIAQDYFLSCKAQIMSEKGEILIPKLLVCKHWEFVLWKLIEEQGQEKYAELVECLRSGRQIAGKRFGNVVGASGKLVFIDTKIKRELRSELLNRSELKSLKTDKGVLILDADKLGENWRVRHWQKGDWMQPLGMSYGRKKLSDLMTELKWSLPQKEEAEVIELEGNRVAALLCERIDESLKITDDTKRVLRLWYESATD